MKQCIESTKNKRKQGVAYSPCIDAQGNNSFLCSLSIVLFSLLMGCTKTSLSTEASTGQPQPQIHIPLVKPAGNPKGSPFTRAIGPDGGTIASEDHVITIDVPAGAVNALTNFSIQRVSNNLNTIHPAYRFLPEGMEFNKSLTITYNYANDSLYGNNPAYFNLVYRDANGHYFKPKGMVHHAQAETFTLLTTHFSDWSITENYEIHAGGQTAADPLQPPHLEAGEAVQLFVRPCFSTADDTSQLYLPSLLDPSVEQNALWKIVSGPGLLEVAPVNHRVVTYHAPANVAAPATVLISCTLNGHFGSDNLGNPVQQLILLQTIYLDASFFAVSVDGGDPVQLFGVGVTDIGNGIAIAGQDLGGEQFLAAVYGYGAATYAFDFPGTGGAAYMEMNNGLLSTGYHTYYPKDCDGNNNKLSFSSGAVTISRAGNKTGDYVTGKIEGATVYLTNWCGAAGVKKHLISGTFNIKRKA